jgi:para-aminobenzoate synthetase
MRTLLIDNYDSFTYNVFQLLAEVNGSEPMVLRNDEASWEEMQRLEFDNVVISPGPGHPDRVEDFGVCADVVRDCRLPLLGICLGFQGLCSVHGASIAHAPAARHGQLSPVEHDDSPLFAGIPDRHMAVRYHSLCVEEPLPDCLRPIAWADDGVLMAVAHRWRPQWGVQFHPESICADHGLCLLANFARLSEEAVGLQQPRSSRRRRTPSAPSTDPRPAAGLRLLSRRLDGDRDPELVFESLYGESEVSFWLDGEGGRFSFLGDARGPLAATISYDLERRRVDVRRGAVDEVRPESIFEFLARELRRLRLPCDELPFDFNCGLVGYLGYELKAECGGDAVHRSELPDAAFVFADRLLAFDREQRCTHLVCLVDDCTSTAGEDWLEETTQRLRRLDRAGDDGHAAEPGPVTACRTTFRLARPRQRYLEDIQECGHRLRDGDTYEVCLTNQVIVEAAVDSLPLYRRLRRLNPAPYSAYLRLGDVAVLSSSPERFLGIDRRRTVEARPIKGTIGRSADPREDARLAARLRGSEKDRAENLMITDLLRNDLGEVCEVGSVEVPQLMEVETYASVHQLVSVVRGRLREGVDAVGCVRACFPAGSMTGAPKKRTMEIIDQLEDRARGAYSGTLGYFGLGGGCDLSVVIRTIIVGDGRATIGIGGGIVLQSDSHDEYHESLLKGRAPMQSIDPCARLEPEPARPRIR